MGDRKIRATINSLIPMQLLDNQIKKSQNNCNKNIDSLNATLIKVLYKKWS